MRRTVLAALWSVGRRTREFGIKLAVGARPRDVVRQVMRQGLSMMVSASLWE